HTNQQSRPTRRSSDLRRSSSSEPTPRRSKPGVERAALRGPLPADTINEDARARSLCAQLNERGLRVPAPDRALTMAAGSEPDHRLEEHTSELQSPDHL